MSKKDQNINLIQNISSLSREIFYRQVNASGVRQWVTNEEQFSNQFEQLVSMFDTLTIKDVMLEYSPTLFPPNSSCLFVLPEDCQKTGKVSKEVQCFNEGFPTYIHIYQDYDISLGIWIVSPGNFLPLHDHPNMFGIIKVVQGHLEILTYNKISPLDKIRQKVPKELIWMENSTEKANVIATQRTMDKIIDATSPPLVLMPNKDNFHEIFNLSDQPAAFVDILAPPYNQGESEFAAAGDLEKRQGDYFEEIQLFASGIGSITWLKKASERTKFKHYYEPYVGPMINF